jgi:acetyl-CoA carboxylase carboxyl transferase subunit alpha
VVIGEGASGGALGIGVGDRVYMLENTWYSVISPESCSSILWRSWENKEQAAEALKLTAEDNLEMSIIDGIIPEPLGGAHKDHKAAFAHVKNQLVQDLKSLSEMEVDAMIESRINKFSGMGVFASNGSVMETISTK